MSDPIVRARVDRLLRGEVREDDLTRLFLFARDRCDGRECVQEIGDFVAHHNERTKGITTNTVKDWSVIVRLRGWMPNQKLDLQHLPSIFPDYLWATSRRLDHKTIKKETGLTRSEAAAVLPFLIARLVKNQDGSYAVNPFTTRPERAIIECFVSHMVVVPAFTDTHLFDDFSATLKSNGGLLNKDEVHQFRAFCHYIILFAAVQMHRCSIVVDEGFAIPLSLMGHANGCIQVDCPIPMFFQLPNIPILNLSTVMFKTDLKTEEYCEPSLLKEAAPWTFPLELSAGRIRQFQ